MRFEKEMKITKTVIENITAHAREEAPVEACGYLASKDGVISLSYALTNIDKSSEHFSFKPQEQFAAVKDARSMDMEICAVYHSHPASPARPSEEDIKLAYDPNMVYFIISLNDAEADVRAFSIKSGNVIEIDLEIINE